MNTRWARRFWLSRAKTAGDGAGPDWGGSW
jgi:hypothetical protein